MTVLAGLSTGIGSAIAFFAKRTDYRFLSVSTGFSAGVMLYVSFGELLASGEDSLTTAFGEPWGQWLAAASFFGGMLVIGLIDWFVPAAENPHEVHAEKEMAVLHQPPSLSGGQGPESRRLLRMGLFTALAIMIHNFPEGLVTFFAALDNPKLGVAIAVAIALHNIPEGISVSVPIFYATGNRGKAFTYSLVSGLAEPIGAVAAYLVLRLVLVDGDAFPVGVMGVVFGAIAGIMVYISLDELLPTSRMYGKGHDSILGVVGGMGLMALSLLLMR